MGRVLTPEEDRKYQTRSAHLSAAISLIDQLEQNADKVFDPATLKGTRALTASLMEQYEEQMGA
jgi:hypothetical protein